MITLKDILVSLGADFTQPVNIDKNPDGTMKNPYGTGLILHGGLVVKCRGTPAIDPVSGLNVITDQHVIGTLTDVPIDGKQSSSRLADWVVPAERADEAVFTLDPAQATLALPAAKLVCQLCGQPPVI